MEPIIMVVLGTLIGGMVIAMYLPIFQNGPSGLSSFPISRRGDIRAFFVVTGDRMLFLLQSSPLIFSIFAELWDLWSAVF